MSFTPKDSAIPVDKSLEEKIANASFEEIKQLLKDQSVAAGVCVQDYYDKTIYLPLEQSAPAPPSPKVGRILKVDGKAYLVEAETEEGLAAAIDEFYRGIFQQPAPPAAQQQRTQPRNTDFTDAEQAEAVRKSELELRFKRGEISASQYLEESNAVADYLAQNGVDMESLRTVSGQRFEQSWSDAAATFAQQHPDWPGGEQNKNLLGRVIEANGWMDAEDKAAALHAAYEQLKAQDALIMTPEQELSDKLANAKSHSEVSDALESLRPRGSSGFFGR
jgi:hypothetical protein